MVTLLEKKKQRGTALVIPLLVFMVFAFMPGASAYTATLVSPTNLTNVHNGDLVSIQVNGLAENNIFQLNISSADLNTTGGTFSINNFAMPFGFVNTTASTSLVGDNLNASGLLLVVARADGVTITQQNQTTANPYRIFLTNDILKTSYNVSITGYPQNTNGAIIDFSVRGDITNPNNPAFLNFTISNIQSGHLRLRVNDGTTNQLDTNLTLTPNPDKIGVYQNGNWYVDINGNGVWDTGDKYYGFGTTGWTPVLGKWTSDGISKIGIYNGGNWYIDYNGDGQFIPSTGDKYIPYGTTGWTQLVGDWNGDGISDIGIYKDAVWYLDYGGSGVIDANTRNYQFGAAGWMPIIGDWNGDKKSEIGVYQNGNWYLDYNGNGVWGTGDRYYGFGAVGWTPIVGKWTSDGISKIGIYNGGNWYLDSNGDGQFTGSDKYIPYGTTGWTQLVGDWNDDGKSEIGIYNNAVWYLDYGGNGVIDTNTRYYQFGAAGWTPIVGNWR